MIADFVRGHKTQDHPRSPENLRAAYFGERPVANLLVATRGGRVIGMVQWARFYDAFWSMFGIPGEWLYVRPEARGPGIAVALIVEIRARGRREGAVFLRGGALTDDVKGLYERCAIGSESYECLVPAKRFTSSLTSPASPCGRSCAACPPPISAARSRSRRSQRAAARPNGFESRPGVARATSCVGRA